jgi:hypothetical protein
MLAVTACRAVLYFARSRWHILTLTSSNDCEVHPDGLHFRMIAKTL